MLVLQNYGAVDPEHLHELGDAHGRDEGVAVVDADADDGARLGVRRRVGVRDRHGHLNVSALVDGARPLRLKVQPPHARVEEARAAA